MSLFEDWTPPPNPGDPKPITQNQRSAGVATATQQRERDDFYPTPPDATIALLAHARFEGAVWEPACGDGAISEVLEASGFEVISSDLVDRGYGTPRVDFLMEHRAPAPNIITNPPYKLGDEFIAHAVTLYQRKLALLMPLRGLAGKGRHEIYKAHPPALVLVFPYRLIIYRGRRATEDDDSGMIDMAWFVWDRHHRGPPILEWVT